MIIYSIQQLLFLQSSFSDSLCLLVKNTASFENKMHNHMDFSNYPEEHPKHDKSNQNELGFWKNELCGVSDCLEFVGLRSKSYALLLKNRKNAEVIEKKVCKGLGKKAIRNRLKFSEYKECLFEGSEIRHHFTSILSKKHDLFTVVRKKKALSRFDSKRWLLSCGIHSFPFNSYLIYKYGNKCVRCSK